MSPPRNIVWLNFETWCGWQVSRSYQDDKGTSPYTQDRSDYMELVSNWLQQEIVSYDKQYQI